MENFESPPPPPSSPPPPPLITLPLTPPLKRGRGWMIFAIIVVVLLLISLLGNFTQLVGGLMKGSHVSTSMHQAGPKLDEVVLEDNDASDKIAVVEVEGIITSQGLQGGFDRVELVRAQLERAASSRKVRAVILKVNSPGGEVLASDEIKGAIADFQKKTHKPVIASMGSLAASGGYYVSAPCEWIVANELTITGSIGVIMHGFNYRGLMDKIGLQPQVYKSGKFKDMLSGSRRLDEIPAEERAMVQSLIDQTYAKFKGVVGDGRAESFKLNKGSGRKMSSDWESYADGRVLSGKEAFNLGFVDELGNFQTAVERAKILAKIRVANLIQYRQRIEFGDLFSLLGKSDSHPPAVKIDLGIEAPKIEAGLLYFYWSPSVFN